MWSGRRYPLRVVTLLAVLVACGSPVRPAPRAPRTAASVEQTSAAPAVAAAPREPEESLARAVSPEATESVTEPEEIDDGFESTVTLGEERPHPLAKVSDADLEKRLISDPTSVGSMSIGRPSGGTLVNGVRMPPGTAWSLVDPDDAWGTEETVKYLADAIGAVTTAFPETRPLPIGHISAKNGGALQPHLSHQSGRDVDIGYYYRDDTTWYRRGNAENLDLERTWAFVRALVTHTDVEMILIDHSIQRLLREHAERVGEDAAWLDDLFRGRGPHGPLIRHAAGHATHLHIRFFNPIAQETARRCVPILVRRGLVDPPVHFVQHRVKKNETLAKLAKRYGVTVREIQRANGLKNTLIQAKKTYRIPKKGPPPMSSDPVRVPGRRLPPPTRPGP